jgi:hypothetical protein
MMARRVSPSSRDDVGAVGPVFAGHVAELVPADERVAQSLAQAARLRVAQDVRVAPESDQNVPGLGSGVDDAVAPGRRALGYV